jgi:6-phosphogluconolactonase
VRIVSDESELARIGAELFARCSREAVSRRGRFSVALSGGSTPKRMLELLASPQMLGRIPWKSTDVFWGDERMVPLDHPESNFRMAWETLLQFVPIPSERIHRIRTELGTAQDAAADYERRIRDFGSRFDLIWLGMGEEGHTASLFPEVDAATESGHWVIAPWVPHLRSYRISITTEVINSSRLVAFLIGGDKKASVLKRVLEGSFDPALYPAQRVRPRDGQTLWLIDEEAASKLGAQTRCA